MAVDDMYSGLIAKKELYGDVQVGGTVAARVIEVKGDGRLDLSIRERHTYRLRRMRKKF